MATLPLQLERTFAADERSVAEARSFARLTLEDAGAGDLTDPAVLAVSELVTNAVVHAGTPARMSLRLDARALRIEVEDQNADRVLPIGPATPSAGDEHGRGLLVAASLASSWGVEYSGATKVVWLRLDRPRPASTVVGGRPRGGSQPWSEGVAVVGLSEAGGVSSWNEAAVALLGWSRAEVVDRPFAELVEPIPGERVPDQSGSQEASWQGAYSVVGPLGDHVRVFASHVGRGPGRGTAVLLVDERERALLEHPHTEPLRAPETPGLGLSDDALARLDLPDYLTLAVERVRDRMGADASYLLMSRDPDELEVAAVSGLPQVSLGRRLRPGEPGGLDRRVPHLPTVMANIAEGAVPLLSGSGLASLVVGPVVAGGRVVGALGVASQRPGGFTAEEATEVLDLANTLAVATDRARMQVVERERHGWLSFLAEAADLLSGTLDPEMTMAVTGQVLVPRLARWCAIYLDDERGSPVLQQAWHEDEEQTARLRETLAHTHPARLEDPAQRPVQGEVELIPLVARGRSFGILVLGRPEGDPVRGEMQLVLDSLARRVGLAIDNANMHGELQAAGEALQRSLLPPAIPALPGIQVGVVYEAAGQTTMAGGDFYDFFPVGGGSWCFAIGDVCGTGPEAAAVTGLARHTIRALVQAGFPVGATLERLNKAIFDEGPRARFLTLVCGTLRPQGQGATVGLVCAGHPPPLAVRCDGRVEQCGRPQSLLGVLDHVDYATDQVTLDRGDLLSLVTDGVLERRDGSRMLGEDGLAAELRETQGLSAQAVADRVRKLVTGFAPEPQRDDMAILTIRVGP